VSRVVPQQVANTSVINTKQGEVGPVCPQPSGRRSGGVTLSVDDRAPHYEHALDDLFEFRLIEQSAFRDAFLFHEPQHFRNGFVVGIRDPHLFQVVGD
jgi:hypothetical protein